MHETLKIGDLVEYLDSQEMIDWKEEGIPTGLIVNFEIDSDYCEDAVMIWVAWANNTFSWCEDWEIRKL